MPLPYPLQIFSGACDTPHVQGIALDLAEKTIYYSFTTALVKADWQGNVIGTVEGIAGHLGCIAFNPLDGRVYASLEQKHDAIGRGIMEKTGRKIAAEDAFYIAIFDVSKINRPQMDAERDGVMTSVYLPEVVYDYTSAEANGHPHRYGCSGIDGIGIGPDFGRPDGESFLCVAYGIYGEPEREGNDHQILLQFDWRDFSKYEQPLLQNNPHQSGPKARNKYFLYTGNTTWGVQNLEYDAFTGDWYLAVYEGKKPQFPNFPLYVIDGAKAARKGPLAGRNGEHGLLLSLRTEGAFHKESGLFGLLYSRGQTGMFSLGNGYFYMSYDGRTPNGLQTCVAKLCRRVKSPNGFEVVEE